MWQVTRGEWPSFLAVMADVRGLWLGRTGNARPSTDCVIDRQKFLVSGDPQVTLSRYTREREREEVDGREKMWIEERSAWKKEGNR